MKLLSIQISTAVEIQPQGTNEWWDKEWRTSFFKKPVTDPVWLGYEGLRGDECADSKHHGGVDKAVCVYASEHYPYWTQITGIDPLPHGGFAENFTTEGLLETEICVGDIYSLGEATVQISQPRQPCWKLSRRWKIKDLSAQVEANGFTGFYFRVIHHGHVKPGDSLELRGRPNPRWTLQICNEIMHQKKGGAEAALQLSRCPDLSGSWKDHLWRRSSPERWS